MRLTTRQIHVAASSLPTFECCIWLQQDLGFWVLGLGVQFRALLDLADENHVREGKGLLHTSTPPQVETARPFELAKSRGNERWPPSPPDRRDRSRSPRGRSTTRRPVTAPLRYSLRQ